MSNKFDSETVEGGATTVTRGASISLKLKTRPNADEKNLIKVSLNNNHRICGKGIVLEIHAIDDSSMDIYNLIENFQEVVKKRMEVTSLIYFHQGSNPGSWHMFEFWGVRTPEDISYLINTVVNIVVHELHLKLEIDL